MIIGEIEGYPVEYNKITDVLTCKNVITTGSRMINAYQSGNDRVTIQDDLVLRIFENKVTLGCFNLTLENSRKLIQTIKKSKR